MFGFGDNGGKSDPEAIPQMLIAPGDSFILIKIDPVSKNQVGLAVSDDMREPLAILQVMLSAGAALAQLVLKAKEQVQCVGPSRIITLPPGSRIKGQG